MAFGCTLVTPEQQAFSEQIVQAIVPAHDGQIGVLTDRAPLMAKLGVGELRLDLPGGQKRVYFVDGGIAQVRDNHLTILTDVAIPQGQLDAEQARAELAEALAIQPTDEQTTLDRDHRIARARAMEHMAAAR